MSWLSYFAHISKTIKYKGKNEEKYKQWTFYDITFLNYNYYRWAVLLNTFLQLSPNYNFCRCYARLYAGLRKQNNNTFDGAYIKWLLKETRTQFTTENVTRRKRENLFGRQRWFKYYQAFYLKPRLSTIITILTILFYLFYFLVAIAVIW